MVYQEVASLADGLEALQAAEMVFGSVLMLAVPMEPFVVVMKVGKMVVESVF